MRFRFWLGHITKMTYAHRLEEIPTVIPEFTKDIISLHSFELYDKIGVEIFKGDIIEIDDFELHFKTKYSTTIQIIKPYRVLVDSLKQYPFLKEVQNNCRVIGNYYEHKHLLDEHI